jgi:hypothetical protein
VADVAVELAMHRVVLEQVRERRGVREIVDGHKVDVGDALLFRGTKHLAADTAEAVDANTYTHSSQFRVKSESGAVRSPGSGARPKVTQLIIRAPPRMSAWTAAFTVAAVVMTSSTSTTCWPRSRS